MAKGYMFYDDETANRQQRICQLAYVLYDNDGNQVGEPICQLIDPESEFEGVNIGVHGIRPANVEGMPTIADFCEETPFLEHLRDYVFVAHNAKQADRHHIYKSLAAYGIEMPTINLIDTRELCANCLGFGRLVDACAHLGIGMGRHHDALADALACRELFVRLARENAAPEPIEWIPGTASSRGGGYTARPIDGLGFTNKTHQPIEDVLDEFDRMGLRKDPNDVETLDGLRIVVTGTVPGYVGDAIEVELKQRGAKTSGSVSSKTELLAIGHNAGMGKIDPAKEKGVPVISVSELLEIIDR